MKDDDSEIVAADRGGEDGVVLQATALNKRFGAKGKPQVQALDGVSIEVRRGEVAGLVGPDGAGKTTLLRLAAGLLAPDGGTVRAFGLDCTAEAVAVQSLVGYMPQQFGLYQDLTVRENLDLFADLQGVPREERAERYRTLSAMTGLEPFTDRRAGNLSGGMKQKLGLACSLIKSPRLLLLDEPTVGVDPVSRRELWRIVYRLVEEAGIGVLMATSYLDEADRCRRVAVLHQGKILAQGAPAEFTGRMRGRVFTLVPRTVPGARTLQSRLAASPGILDATIRSGRVRCVVGEGRDVREFVPAESVAEILECEPSFEDAFMAMVPRGEARSGEAGQGGRESNDWNKQEKEPVVRARNLKKYFGDFEAVKGISFEVRRGEVFGLLGPNGAGKSTTFRMLCGLSRVSDGEASVDGKDLRRARAQARSRLGYVAQIFSLYRQLTVRANLEFYGKAYGLGDRRLRERIDWALDEFDLRTRQDSPAGDLPGGYRQRLAMAAALLHEPAILFLDEPTSGADPLARREFWLRINRFVQEGVTVIVTTHFMEEAEYCDRMLIMSSGVELARGTPEEIRALARTEENPDPTVEDAFIALAEGATPPRPGDRPAGEGPS